MHLRTFAAATIVAAAVSLPLAGTALAADRDCADFASQAEAQAAYQPGDPERLDADDDGQACENHDYGSVTPAMSQSDDQSDDQVAAKPTGGVETGGGPEPAISGGLAAVLGAVAAGGVGAVAARRFARR